MPVNDDLFVQWCLERLGDAGATLTPLMRPARWPLRQLVNEASSPLSACLAAMPTGALFRSKDGEQSRVLLETPFVSYEPYEPVTPKPSKKRDDASLDRTWIAVWKSNLQHDFNIRV